MIRQISPATAVIDITHEVPAHDIRSGGLTLARSVQYLTPGVVLAVVDPAVGTARRAIAVEVGDGESILVGPDNGLLAPAVAMVGGATRAVELTATEYHLGAASPTFAGRDIFAPVAAHLCNGVALEDLGPEVDPYALTPATIPITREHEGELLAEVLWTDRFGNLQLNVDPAEIEHLGQRVDLRFGTRARTGIRRTTYAEVEVGEIGLIVDSYGLVSIAVNRGSAAEELGLDTGDEVRLVLDPAQVSQGTATPVELGLKPRA